MTMTGDDEAIARALYPALRRFAAVVSPGDADDLVQHALVKVLAKHRLADLDHPLGYLRTAIVRTASNERRDGWRRRRRERAVAPFESVVSNYPSDLDDLLRLEPEARAVLFLAEVERLPFAEIALILGCSEDAARARASRARRQLRAELVEER
jgi:DNA-directed RNA polymerase specialized sigma24 family protein